MKRLIFLCGPNGVGKTTLGQALLKMTPRSAYVDSDPLRLMNPFALTDETIPTIAKNISDVIANDLACPAVDTVFFSYGLHGRRTEVFARVMQALGTVEMRFLPFVIWCGEAENLRRMRADGRDEERIARALTTSRAAYADVPYPRIDVTNLTVQESARRVLRMAEEAARAYRVVPMTRDYAEAIARWTYPGIYAVYSFAPDAQTRAELMNGAYVACLDEDDALVGYFCFGQAARIPTAAQDVYDAGATDMGLGLRPDACGCRRSGAFLRCGMDYARKECGAGALRLTVAGFNARAIRAYEKAGFVMQRKIFHARTGEAFYVMRQDGGI